MSRRTHRPTGPLRDPRRRRALTTVIAVGAVLAAAVIAAWAHTGPPAAPMATRAPPGGLVIRLEDQVRDLPGGRIAWRTDWVLCWDPYPGAVAYELQALTSEGASPRLARQAGRCLRLKVAAGRNQRHQGLRGRQMLLALQLGQLAYRVRALLDNQQRSRWLATVAAGAAAGRPPGSVSQP
jgi:hypothetical protein